jgi:hypothetical protein
MTRTSLLAFALLLTSCGPKTLELPEEPVDRAATCGVVAANSARAATADVKADLPFEAIGRVLHYPLLAGSAGGSFSSETATQVQTRMTELQNRIAEGKWQDLVPACKAAFPAAFAEKVTLPDDRFEAQLACDELGDFLRSALEEQGKYDNETGKYRDMSMKLDPVLGTGLRARAGADVGAQEEERRKALARAASLGSPVAVMRECVGRFG